MPEEAKAGENQELPRVKETINLDPHRERTVLLPFDAVKIRLFTKEGNPLPSGLRRVFGHCFEVEAPRVREFLVKHVGIAAVGVEFNYANACEFDLPAALEVGPNGILQKTVPDLFPVGIVSYVRADDDAGHSCSHRGGMP